MLVCTMYADQKNSYVPEGPWIVRFEAQGIGNICAPSRHALMPELRRHRHEVEYVD